MIVKYYKLRKLDEDYFCVSSADLPFPGIVVAT